MLKTFLKTFWACQIRLKIYLTRLLVKSGILLQQATAPLEGISAHFLEYVLHHPQGNERTGDIRFSWIDVTTAAGPILIRLSRATKMVVI